ncbi:zinc finger protein Rlf [Bombina bombina]|uniref:zinc finger protein Rlf n=1 Tax=Bombina bombina TaxID=8345 RepID=UPI00235AEA09|nr:zinc finger protein Rlf [Bombina bombina]
MKRNCTQEAMLLSKLCAESSEVSSDFFFRQTFITCLCTLLPNEEAFKEISRMDGKEVLDIICNLESENQDNTAFILCTTYLTQQLQNEITSCSWELTLFWSKLQRRIDPSLNHFLERCRQFGVIAKTLQHLFFLIKVVHTEAGDAGVSVSIVLCIRALQIQSNETDTTKSSVCKTIACLLPQDLEVRRACQLTEFLFEPTADALNTLEDLFMQPDQKNDEETSVISNSLRCELLLALKSHWMFDPEFWDWKTLKRHCLKLLGKESSDAEEENYEGPSTNVPDVLTSPLCSSENNLNETQFSPEDMSDVFQSHRVRKPVGSSERYKRWLQYKFFCVICKKEIIEARILHHAKMHLEDGVYTCPVCLKKIKKKEIFVTHVMGHMTMPTRHRPKKKKKNEKSVYSLEEDYVEDEFKANGYLSFKAIQDRNLQDRDVYPCPGTNCSREFKQFKYLSIHLKGEHSNNDENAEHYLLMKNLREKCAYCRRHFITNFHLRQHKRIHLGPLPFMCVSLDCNAMFKSINELLIHRQSHLELQFKCELEGCSLVFTDLGLLYHHEAQHFRDASFTCNFPGCKKFFYCTSELREHIASHQTLFGKNNDNETCVFKEIKNEQESFLPSSLQAQLYSYHDRESICSNSPTLSKRDLVTEMRIPSFTGVQNCKQSTFSDSSPNKNDCSSDSETSLSQGTHFDYFSKNAVKEQSGQQMLRPAQFTQNKATEATDVFCTAEGKNLNCLSSEGINEESTNANLDSQTPTCATSPHTASDVKQECNEILISGEYHRSASDDTLFELLTSLKHLNLKNSNACITNIPPPDHDDRASSSKNYTPPQKQEHFLSPYLAQLSAKPYFCELKGCKKAFVTKDALLVHYVKKHHYTREETLKLEMFHKKYSPFECHICHRSFTRRTLLRIHYRQKHLIGKERVNKARHKTLENKQSEKHFKKERHSSRLRKFKRNETARGSGSFSDVTYTGNGVSISSCFGEDFESRKGRGSKRTVAQGKLCYILNKYHKPFNCIHAACNSSFTTQRGLVRHYRIVHHYNREQLCLEKDREKSKREYIRSRKIFTCKFKECRKSFICSRALVRHYKEFHNHVENEIQELDIFCAENQFKPQMDDQKQIEETKSNMSEICCDVDYGAAFTDHTIYSQHISSYQRKYKLFDGRRKRKNVSKVSKDVRENYVDQRPRSHSIHKRKKVRVKNKVSKKDVIDFKTKEEALQMCAQNVDITQYPCRVHGCASVVKLESSIVRHYKLSHNITPSYISNNFSELVFCVKNFPQFENDESVLSKNLSPNKLPTLDLQEGIRTLLGQKEEHVKQMGDTKINDAVQKVSFNLSASVNNEIAPICIRESVVKICKSKQCFANVSEKETACSVKTQRLENNLVEWPQHTKDSKFHCSTDKNSQDQDVPNDAGLKNFKPTGFESSFLKFLEQSRETDDDSEVEYKPPKQCKLQNSFQNRNRRVPQEKTSEHGSLGGFQPLLSNTVQSSVSVPTLEDLRTILDKALTNCGDLALKQLHYQRPVVVLERSKFTTPLIDLFSGKKTDELCVGIS